MTEKAIIEIFGSEGLAYSNIVSRILDSHDNPKYKFISETEFKELADIDIRSAQAQYINEILYRVNFSSLSALARNFEWFNSIVTCYENDQYLPFASSLRCFIESAADSFHGLGNICTTLAKNKNLINSALNKANHEFIIIKELEDQLIHFTHARKVGRHEDVPDSHKADSASNYVKNLDKARKNTECYDCYAQLCQLSHPAAQGLLPMMVPLGNDEFIFSCDFGQEKIKHFIIEPNKKMFSSLLTFAFNPAILSLKMLNNLDQPQMHTASINELNLDHIIAWQHCEKLMQES